MSGNSIADKCRKRQYVPISEYMSTLEGMVQVARDHNIKNILLITPPPVDEAARIRWNQQVRHSVAHGRVTSRDLLNDCHGRS